MSIIYCEKEDKQIDTDFDGHSCVDCQGTGEVEEEIEKDHIIKKTCLCQIDE